MSEIEPTFESIFTRKYWGETKPYGAPQYDRGRIPRDVYKQMKTLVSRAAVSIFEGEPREAVSEGTILDKGGNNPNTMPGTVLLIDMEGLRPSPRTPSRSQIAGDWPEVFHRQNYIHEESDLMALPSSLFRMNSKTWQWDDGATTVYPYKKGVYNPETNMQYVRSIRLLSYCIDKEGESTYRIENQWDKLTEKGIKGVYGGEWLEPLSPLLPPVAVGHTYEKEGRSFFRVSAAEVCLNGTIEYSKAKKKSRRKFFAGKLATAHGLN